MFGMTDKKMNDDSSWSTLLDRLSRGVDLASILHVQKDEKFLGDPEQLFSDINSSSTESIHILLAFDTNCLKRFRYESLLLQSLLDTVESFNSERIRIEIIIPGQSYVEYHNNHSSFTKEKINRLNSELGKVNKLMESDNWAEIYRMGFAAHDDVNAIKVKLDEFMTFYNPDDSHSGMKATFGVVDELLKAGARVPFVPRDKFYDLGKVRLDSKTPPGWGDVSSKGVQSLGDFYCWMDFLYSTFERATEMESRSTRLAVFVSDDVKKSDWNVGTVAHPFLAAECHSITGYSLRKIPTDSLNELILALKKVVSRPE